MTRNPAPQVLSRDDSPPSQYPCLNDTIRPGRFRLAAIHALCWVLLLGQLGCTRLNVASLPTVLSPPMDSLAPSTGNPAQPATQLTNGQNPVTGAIPGESATAGVEAATVVSASPSLADAAGVRFTAHRSAVAARNQMVFAGKVLTQLWLEREGRWELVHRGDSPTWLRSDLIPGRYLLEVVEIQENGRRSAPNDDKQVTFTLEAGNTADVVLVVKKVPWGPIILVTLGVVIIAGLVVLAVLLKDDMPNLGSRPGRTVHGSGSGMGAPPPPRISAPTPRIGGHSGPMVHLYTPTIYTSFDLLVPYNEPIELWSPGYWEYAQITAGLTIDANQPRLVEFRFPSTQNTDGRIRLVFDRPMMGASLAPGAVLILDAVGHTVPVGMYLENQEREVIYHPLRPLNEGTYRVVVRGTYIYDLKGYSLGKSFEQTFQINAPSMVEEPSPLMPEPSFQEAAPENLPVIP